MDPASSAVFGALLLNVIVTSLIVVGWLILRKYRGDKSDVKENHHESVKHGSNRVSVLSSGGYYRSHTQSLRNEPIKGSVLLSGKDLKNDAKSDLEYNDGQNEPLLQQIEKEDRSHKSKKEGDIEIDETQKKSEIGMFLDNADVLLQKDVID